ncbi:MAG: S-ribosylhomocysteine lyase [Firmicutes bacterium]|nr:S-ribosylhomocysteine lyase [Bacillota bacterium]
MNEIPSFTIDHLKIKRGVFVSAKYNLGGGALLTVFDLRLKQPYAEPVMETGAIHALEHILAVNLRSDSLWGSRIIYFGPMGCRTGFYLIMTGDLSSEDILPLLERAFDHASDYEGEIPGANPKQCGFCVDMDLDLAKADATMYYNVIIDPKKENLNYPVKRAPKKK